MIEIFEELDSEVIEVFLVELEVFLVEILVFSVFISVEFEVEFWASAVEASA